MSAWSDGQGNWPRLNSTLSRVSAALVGALIATVLLTLCITLWWPFGDEVEQIFAGGVFFFVFWAGFFYWALLAVGGLQAWRRMLLLMIGFGLINAIHFVGG
ncbi:hypothetical protein CHH28_07415 [Bacterioplanes sanyensis]|uniref:Uncharacterized protein n=1 Tax=Bacterioplanes sanyensis TaxID=1249553 RepID=A0A222FIB1_9GAMM|nr:hypothetical protein [Bacterioplanes sanyensis]ASP38510.1 hypothetical protein CHH28_07415 [Bacterioplanes sanyensis]